MICKKAVFYGAVLIVFLGLIVSGCERESDSLVDNGGFESLSSIEKTPTGWRYTELPGTRDFVDFIWDEETCFGGDRSVSIKIAQDHPEGEVIAYNWYTSLENWKPTKKYELSARVRTMGLEGPAWICVQCWDESHSEMLNFATTQKDYPVSGTSDWQEVGTVFKVPEGTRDIVVRAGIAAPENNGGQAWFDEVAIRQLD